MRVFCHISFHEQRWTKRKHFVECEYMFCGQQLLYRLNFEEKVKHIIRESVFAFGVPKSKKGWICQGVIPANTFCNIFTTGPSVTFGHRVLSVTPFCAPVICMIYVQLWLAGWFGKQLCVACFGVNLPD